MGKQVTVVRSADCALPDSALYTVGATVVLTDYEFNSLPAEYVATCLTSISTVADPNRSPVVSGGSSAVFDRAIYASTGTNATGTKVHFDPTAMVSHGRPLLDFATPDAPVALIAGIYAVTAFAEPAASPGSFLTLFLELDRTGDDPDASATIPMDDPGLGGECTVTATLTYYVPAGGVIWLRVYHDVGSAIDPGVQMAVQLLTEDAS